MAEKKKPSRPYVRWLVLLLIPLVWCGLAFTGDPAFRSHSRWFQSGLLEFIENRTLDWRFRARGEIDSPAKLVYVDVDSQSLSEIGGFPWNRSYYPPVLAALIEHGHVKAIGMDFVFSEAGVPEVIDWRKLVEGNREFARYLSKMPPVVIAASYSASADRDINGQLTHRELPLISRIGRKTDNEPPEVPSFRLSEKDPKRRWSPGSLGLIDTLDGATRTAPAFALTYIRPYYHMAIELARLQLDVPREGVKIGTDHIDLVRADGALAARIPLRNEQLLDVNWFSKWSSPKNPRISYSTVYAYAEMLASEKPEERKAADEFFADPGFKDAVVLIGPVDPLMQDLATTPFDDVPVPKVGVHGNLVKTILSGKYLHRLPTWRGVSWVSFFVVFALTIATCLLATVSGARSTLSKAGAVLLMLAYAGAAFWVFRTSEWVLPLAAPLGAAFTTSFAGVIWQLIEEEKQKGRIKGMFGTYLSPTVVSQMIDSGKDPELGGHDAEITPYFSDIQAFSTFSEVLTSARLTELLNEYLTACTDIVQTEGGSLDKYIGDAVVAMYGAPVELKDHAFRACRAALLVQRAIDELRTKWKNSGDTWPPLVHRLRTRIGLNTGVCMIGNMGSRTRFNYTMMGDNVNLAARMESGAKSWGVYTMCAESTKLACLEHGGDRIVFRALGRIVVKGRTQPVPIHELVGLKEDVTDRTRECIALFEQAMERYYARDWDGAHGLFERSGALEPNQPSAELGIESNPSLVYLKILKHYEKEPPPPEWDGVYVMKEK